MSHVPGQTTPALPPWPPSETRAYTIGTLVTDIALYDAMRRSLIAGGFGESDCEYLAIDNTRAAIPAGSPDGPPQTSAYAGLDRVLAAARGRYVILCHQDIELIGDGRADLDRRLVELEMHDPAWGVAGNAGGVMPGRLALRITDPHGEGAALGPFPARVVSLDENFIVAKRSANLGFSRDLDGFHLYGADLCLQAAMRGYSAYVIDFHLRHLSPGNSKSTDFTLACAAFEARWSHALRSRWLQTTCALLSISGTTAGRAWRKAAGRRVAKMGRRRARG